MLGLESTCKTLAKRIAPREETASIQQLYSGLHELPVLEVRDLVAEAALEPVRRVLGPVAVEDLDMPAAGLRALGTRRRRDVRY